MDGTPKQRAKKLADNQILLLIEAAVIEIDNGGTWDAATVFKSVYDKNPDPRLERKGPSGVKQVLEYQRGLVIADTDPRYPGISKLRACSEAQKAAREAKKARRVKKVAARDERAQKSSKNRMMSQKMLKRSQKTEKKIQRAMRAQVEGVSTQNKFLRALGKKLHLELSSSESSDSSSTSSSDEGSEFGAPEENGEQSAVDDSDTPADIEDEIEVPSSDEMASDAHVAIPRPQRKRKEHVVPADLLPKKRTH